MPLPQKTIDALSQNSARTPGWSGSLLMFCGTLLFISVFVYGGLQYGYLPYLNDRVKKLKDQTQNFNRQVPVEDQQKIVTFYSQLTNMRSILDKKTAATPLLRWLEASTVPNIFYVKVSFNATNQQIAFSGEARSVPDITSQVTLFQADPNVERVNLGNMSVGGGNLWQFDLTVFLKHPIAEDGLAPNPISNPQASSSEDGITPPAP